MSGSVADSGSVPGPDGSFVKSARVTKSAWKVVCLAGADESEVDGSGDREKRDWTSEGIWAHVQLWARMKVGRLTNRGFRPHAPRLRLCLIKVLFVRLYFESKDLVFKFLLLSGGLRQVAIMLTH